MDENLTMIKRIKIKLILLELIALIFIVSGLQRVYLATQGVKYDALANRDWDKFEDLIHPETASQFFVNRVLWTFGFTLCLIFIIGLINWKNKVEIINSIILFIIVLSISSTGFFLRGVVNQYLNYFCGLFGESYGIAFTIGGALFFMVGAVFFWKAISLSKI